VRSAENFSMSLWSNDGQLDEAAKVGLWVVLRKVGRNGSLAAGAGERRRFVGARSECEYAPA